MTSNSLHSAESVMHYTPEDIVQRAVDTLGGEILLDPASDAFGNATVCARNFYPREGLVRPWFGPLFVNPPGRSDDNPGGASAWWHKLIAEWELASGSWSAIFVGFSLEILQTCQSKGYRHPLRFPTCVPKQRIKFDVNAAVLRSSLVGKLEALKPKKCGVCKGSGIVASTWSEYASEPCEACHMRELAYAAAAAPLNEKLAKIESAMKRGERRYPGNSPTHGNFITCVTVDGGVQERFRAEFSPIGVVSGC